ncbi:DUF7695 domain-containing protein [Aneurinibacillus aneurinilyticus]|uniref:DUF7695 domain-containing protein n=1 Tax=Aneurinibacillus aneurinilyticus TaxID=1391 RepID=UPI003C6CA3B0
MRPKLKRNIIRCKKCGDTIESTHTHEFKWYSCGHVAIDGGLDYGKRSYQGRTPEDSYEDLSEYEEVRI